MTDELIKYPTAVLAKEKGFDWYTSTYIDDEEDIIEDDTAPLIGAIPAPTQSLLQRWLRESHNIDISIERMNNGLYIGYSHNKTFITYEEALEDALVHALNLL